LSFHATRNGTSRHEGSALHQRALRFAGVRIGAVETAKPRPELVRTEADGAALEHRLKRFVFRSGGRP